MPRELSQEEWDIINWNKDYRKNKDISYFNSLNAAINVMAYLGQTLKTTMPAKNYESGIIKWRDFFIKEWETNWLKQNPKPGLTNKAQAEQEQSETLEEHAQRIKDETNIEDNYEPNL